MAPFSLDKNSDDRRAEREGNLAVISLDQLLGAIRLLADGQEMYCNGQVQH
jgi:hypothetical protein